MELFDLIIIVLVREVLILEILLEPFPHNIPFINILYLLEVLPHMDALPVKLKMATLAFIFPE